MRIAAAIPTVNRLESLKRCLDTVRAQSRPVDEIIVVNNGSRDGTGKWLDEQPRLVVIHDLENRGASSGFHIAMRTAYERGHDWVFVMDDDVYARPEALERLLEAAHTLQAQGVRIGGLQTLDSKWDTDGPARVPYFFPSTARQAWRYLHSSREIRVEKGRGAPMEIDLYACFGALISREALGSAGFPDPEFVYWCDDFDLACRQRALGFRHYLVPRAVVEHKSSEQQYRLPPKIDWRYYYMYRNRWRFMRVHGHLFGQPMKIAYQARIVERMLMHTVAAAKHGNFRGSRLVLQAFFDGVLGRMGKRVALSDVGTDAGSIGRQAGERMRPPAHEPGQTPEKQPEHAHAVEARAPLPRE